jgi:predicted PurR-regulated permease PerM
MNEPDPRWPATATVALVVIAGAATLALLYLARAVLVPVTLAMVLSFATAPFVRGLRRLRIGHVASVLVAVISIAAVVTCLAMLIGSRGVRIAESYPVYRETFERNVRTLRSAALAPVEKTWDAVERLIDPRATDRQGPLPAVNQPSRAAPAGGAGIAAPSTSRSTPMERMLEVMSLAWMPLASAAIVFIVMIFALLEHASIRDRFIRLVGRSDLRVTTTAINDAGERLARYLARLFSVNIGVGAATWLGLSAIGLPDAALVAALTALLRFVPFLGVPSAAAVALLLALGAAPGWTLALATLAVFATIELFTAHAIEPRVYGNATGLSPLTIVLSAIFWGGLWGPVGLLLSTPLTLCMAVAGRHFEPLSALGVALGDGPALTLAQRFYQRSLSGDPAEIVDDARLFLKQGTFADYCDVVVVPALQLGRIDREAGQITSRQYAALRFAMSRFLAELDEPAPVRAPRAKRASLLEEILSGGLLWRRDRLRQRLDAPGRDEDDGLSTRASAIVLCLGMGLRADELGAELLVRTLRGRHIDARHIKDASDLDALHVYGIATLDVGVVCMVTMTDPNAPEHGVELAKQVGSRLSHARTLALLLPGRVEHAERLPVCQFVDDVTTSFAAALRELETLAA